MQSKFSAIQSILVEDQRTWKDKIFLTFDIDWAPDPVLEHVIDIVEEAEVSATWFVTHKTPVLNRLRANDQFELGVHPNFNPLLAKSRPEIMKSAHDIVQELMEIIPEAKSVRSHSITFSTQILSIFSEFNLTHDVNMYVPFNSGVQLRPWYDASGMARVPFFWEDDVQLQVGAGHNVDEVTTLHAEGLMVFDFHPIHVFLNTQSMNTYNAAKKHFNDMEYLKGVIADGFGVASMLDTLLDRKIDCL